MSSISIDKREVREAQRTSVLTILWITSFLYIAIIINETTLTLALRLRQTP